MSENLNPQSGNILAPPFTARPFNFQNAGQSFQVDVTCDVFVVDSYPSTSIVTLIINGSQFTPVLGRVYKHKGNVKITSITSSVSGIVNLTYGFGYIEVGGSSSGVNGASDYSLTESIPLTSIVNVVGMLLRAGGSYIVEAFRTITGVGLVTEQQMEVLTTTFGGGGQTITLATKEARSLTRITISHSASGDPVLSAPVTITGQNFTGGQVALPVYGQNGHLVSKVGKLSTQTLTNALGGAQLTFLVDATSYNGVQVVVPSFSAGGTMSVEICAAPEAGSTELHDYPLMIPFTYNGALAANTVHSLVAAVAGQAIWLMSYDFALTSGDKFSISDAAGAAVAGLGQGQNVAAGQFIQEIQPLAVSTTGLGALSVNGQANASVTVRYGIVNV